MGRGTWAGSHRPGLPNPGQGTPGSLVPPPRGRRDVATLFPADVALRGAAEPSPAWKALGRQLNAELTGPSWEQPRRCSAGPEQSGQPACREAWSSSLPRPGRSAPPRRISHGGEPAAGTPLPTSPRSGTEGTRTAGDSWPCGAPRALLRGQQDLLMPSPAAFADNRLTPRLAAPSGRRAVSVHEEQLREPQCLAELGSKWGPAADMLGTRPAKRPHAPSAPCFAAMPQPRAQSCPHTGGTVVTCCLLVFPPAVTIPLRLRRSPVLKRRPEVTGEPSPASEAGGEAGGEVQCPSR